MQGKKLVGSCHASKIRALLSILYAMYDSTTMRLYTWRTKSALFDLSSK